MRCRACNVVLTDFESTRKSSVSGDYLDMCNRCLGYIMADMDTNDNFENFDADLDERNMSACLYTGDEIAVDDVGSGPDSDEPEEDGFHPADSGE